MIRLSGNTLTPEGRIRPESCALTLTERASTATITLPVAEATMAVGDWLLEDTDPGAGIVWRIKTVDDTYNTETSSITLEHAINTLRDISMFGEAKPGDITGNKNDKACTARQAAEYVLRHQTIWQLGDFEYDLSAPFAFNGDDLYSALEKISGALDEPWWDYDMTRMPFRLHIRKKTSQKACEMRLGRNITTLRKTVDRSQMYTRIYPIGKKNLHLTGDYVSKNEEIWGRRDKVETDQSQETEEALRIWATDRLNRHCEPQVTITIGGLELSQATGEKLDHLVLGTICQVPLPEFGTTITERITKLAWKDKIKEPENVTVTLCNVRQDLASIISQQAAGGGGGGRAAAKEAEEDHAWFVDTTDHVAMVAEAVAGKDENGGPDWSRVSEIVVDGTGIHAMVVKAQEDIITASSRIDMNEEAITAEVKRATDTEGELASVIQITAERIIEVSGWVNEQGELIEGAQLAIDGANARIDAEAKRIDEANGEISSAKLAIDGANAAITAEVTRATEAEGVLSGRLTVAKDAITAEVTRATEAEGVLSGRLTVAKDAITAEVTRATGAETELAGRIKITEDSIIAQAGQISAQGDLISGAQIAIDGLRGEISQKVSKDGLISEINQSAEKIRISASKIDLDGYVTAAALAADIAAIKREYAGQLTTSHLYVEDGHFADVNVSGTITADQIYGGSNVNLAIHYHNFTPNADGTVTIGGPSATPGSFNIADTQFYKDGVSAARTAGAKSVSLDHITTNYVPSFDPNSLTVNVFLTNGEHFTQAVDVANVYNAGAASVSVAEDSSHIKWQTNVRKIGSIDGTVTVILSNGNEYSRPVTSITAPAVRSVNVNTATDKVTVYYANVTSGYTSSDVFDW